MSKLIIMVGNVASGKSSWIKRYLKTFGCDGEIGNPPVVVSKDGIRIMMGAGDYIWNPDLEGSVHDCLIEMMRIFMFAKVDVIYDETNMDRKTRHDYLYMANRFGYDPIAVLMPYITMEETIRRRLQGKEYAWGFSKEVWESVYTRKDDLFELPTIIEGFKEIWRPNYGTENKSSN